MKIERRLNLSVCEFTDRYLAKNEPVIVVDAVARWNSAEVWTLDFFSANFGRSDVQVYDDLFSLQTICRLQTYFDSCMRGTRKSEDSVPYVRWYSRSQDAEFAWSDAAFAVLTPYWHRPYFLPTSDYLLPRCSVPMTITPVLDPFPGRGIFISATGARTRRHVDPWCSDAVLCQMLGNKAVTLFPPEHHTLSRSERKVNGHAEQPVFQDVLSAGEVLFLPSGWPHAAISLTNCISLTWNFVHSSHGEGFARYLRGDLCAEDRAILSHFGYREVRRDPAYRR